MFKSNQAAKACSRVLLYWQIMRLCWMLFAVVGNILPCYKNYFMYVNSLMSLSLFTKETTDVEMWLRFTRTRSLCNWRSKFPSFHQECECTQAACKQKQQQHWLQLFCKSNNSLKYHINYLDMLQCPDLEAGALLPNWWTSYFIDAESYFRVPCPWQRC